MIWKDCYRMWNWSRWCNSRLSGCPELSRSSPIEHHRLTSSCFAKNSKSFSFFNTSRHEKVYPWRSSSANLRTTNTSIHTAKIAFWSWIFICKWMKTDDREWTYFSFESIGIWEFVSLNPSSFWRDCQYLFAIWFDATISEREGITIFKYTKSKPRSITWLERIIVPEELSIQECKWSSRCAHKIEMWRYLHSCINYFVLWITQRCCNRRLRCYRWYKRTEHKSWRLYITHINHGCTGVYRCATQEICLEKVYLWIFCIFFITDTRENNTILRWDRCNLERWYRSDLEQEYSESSKYNTIGEIHRKNEQKFSIQKKWRKRISPPNIYTDVIFSSEPFIQEFQQLLLQHHR